MDLRFCIRERHPMEMSERRAATWTYVFACFSAGDHMDLRLCMFERPGAIWSYVSAYRSAGGHMDLHFCILERRWRGGRGKSCCGSSFVHLEGVCGGRGGSTTIVLPSSSVHIYRRDSYKTREKQSV